VVLGYLKLGEHIFSIASAPKPISAPSDTFLCVVMLERVADRMAHAPRKVLKPNRAALGSRTFQSRVRCNWSVQSSSIRTPVAFQVHDARAETRAHVKCRRRSVDPERNATSVA
jgi:hypothetical protein